MLFFQRMPRSFRNSRVPHSSSVHSHDIGKRILKTVEPAQLHRSVRELPVAAWASGRCIYKEWRNKHVYNIMSRFYSSVQTATGAGGEEVSFHWPSAVSRNVIVHPFQGAHAALTRLSISRCSRACLLKYEPIVKFILFPFSVTRWCDAVLPLKLCVPERLRGVRLAKSTFDFGLFRCLTLAPCWTGVLRG